MYFVERSFLLRLKVSFLRRDISRGTTIAADNGQADVDLKLEMKRELVLSHYQCHSWGSITQSDYHKLSALPLC